MLKIRLQRVGRKHDPSYRIVATNSRTGPKSNKHVAILGHYDSIRKTTQINDPEVIKDYISKGAQISPRVHNILITEGIVEGKKINVLPKKSPIVKEATEEEAPAEKPAAEETATEEGADDAPTEEAPAEESTDTPAEEPAAEEASTEEAPEAPAE